MVKTLQRSAAGSSITNFATPSILEGDFAKPFTLDQELTAFGKWTSEPIWVPPKDSSKELATSMLEDYGLFSSKSECWKALIEEHRSKFTQVRQIDLCKASIRLPKGKLFVSVTERKDFDKITDTIPNCVKTRLEEFLAGPGRRSDVKVYYLKPLCVELGEKLVFTTCDELHSAIEKIQREVFWEYRKRYLAHRPGRFALKAIDAGLSIPRVLTQHYMNRKKRAVEAYHAHLEFNRRKAALRATNLRRKCRTDACSFDDILSITKTPDRSDVIEQYAIQHKLSKAERDRLIWACAETIPWFVAFSLGAYYLSTLTLTVTLAPPIMVCDPAFVAEMPDSQGVVLKIGHFDEVSGVTHVEI